MKLGKQKNALVSPLRRGFERKKEAFHRKGGVKIQRSKERGEIFKFIWLPRIPPGSGAARHRRSASFPLLHSLRQGDRPR